MPIITVDHVHKAYPRRRGARDLRGRGGLRDWLRGKQTETFDALHDITLAVDAGESLGIIGRNGSGKSTLLKVLAGVTLPSQGTVTIQGRVASLLELGAGFHPILTGRENIYLNAGLLGMRHAQVDEAMDRIIDFSGIAEFIDQPVDTYSSGMYVRIGFAVAVHVNPDIFLVDEVLSVGDEEFQRKCRRKIGELKEQGKTIVFVSHDLGSVNALCDRVILLNKGRMISRGTPQKTIDFYLRQIGRESSIHTMAADRIEAIFSHGRISLFHERNEFTAPMGIHLQLVSLSQHHLSTDAEWAITERTPTACQAAGQLPRLPVALLCSMQLEDNRLILAVALRCQRPVDLELVSLDIFLPTLFQRWYYAAESGPLPAIQPGHLEWSTIVPPKPGCSETVLTAAPACELPPAKIGLDSSSPYTVISLLNSEYVTGARVVHIHARIPRTDQPLAVGEHTFGTITVDMGLSGPQFQDWAAAQEALRVLRAGTLTAKLRAGYVELFRGDTPLTASVHLHTQLRIADLWTVSHMLHWAAVQRDGDCLRLSGESPRFPFKQHWELQPVEDGIALRVTLEALEDLQVQEYNVSLGIEAAYDGWETERESGPFPPFDPQQQTWIHLNKDYGLATFAQASGPALPTLRLESAPESPPCHMTAINTEFGLKTHVLQAIHTPERAGLWLFPPGEHLLFEGLVTLFPPA